MPLLQVNAGPERLTEGLTLHRTRHALEPILRRALQRPGPITIMVHGYKFAPGHPVSCPHEHILSLDPSRRGWKVKSWPRALGYGSGAMDEGLAIAFGWPARGTIWQACEAANRTETHLAHLLELLAVLAPERPVHLLAHSLGARVVLRALPAAGSAHLGRIILLNGAEFETIACTALNSKAGRRAEFINVTSRENDLFDFLLERLVRAPVYGDRCLSHGLPAQRNVLNLQLDHPQTTAALESAGFHLSRQSGRICHWSAYLRPGIFDFYKALLREPRRTDLDHLRAALPTTTEPRWSHLIARPQRTQPDEAPLPVAKDVPLPEFTLPGAPIG